MTKAEVIKLLQKNRDARGEANWKKRRASTGGLASYGIGLTTCTMFVFASASAIAQNGCMKKLISTSRTMSPIAAIRVMSGIL